MKVQFYALFFFRFLPEEFSGTIESKDHPTDTDINKKPGFRRNQAFS